MTFPDERVAEVCQLGPIKAAELLERGRAGDLAALADWTVYSVCRKMIRSGTLPARAIHETREIMAAVDLKSAIAT